MQIFTGVSIPKSAFLAPGLIQCYLGLMTVSDISFHPAAIAGCKTMTDGHTDRPHLLQYLSLVVL